MNNNDNYLEFFALALKENLTEMAELTCEISEPQMQPPTFVSGGLAVVLGITGKRPGRIIIDTDRDTARKLSELMNGEEGIDEELMLDTMAEFGNIVSGHTITHANNAIKGMNLMLTPPGIFLGDQVSIISPKIKAQVIQVLTHAGKLVVSVGFEGGK